MIIAAGTGRARATLVVVMVVGGLIAGWSAVRWWNGRGERSIVSPAREPGEPWGRWEYKDVYTPSYNATMEFLRNDLIRRDVWDDEEAHFIADMMRRPFHAEMDDAADPDAFAITMIEGRSLAGDVMSMYGGRFQSRHAVTDRARAILDPIILERLGDPSFNARLAAMHACFDVGLSDREDVRRHLVRMMTEDPDIRVRKVIERKFKVEDYFRAMREGRPWTPPKKAGAS